MEEWWELPAPRLCSSTIATTSSSNVEEYIYLTFDLLPSGYEEITYLKLDLSTGSKTTLVVMKKRSI